MSATTGMQPINTYQSNIQGANAVALLALIPDPDALPGSGAIGGGGANNTYLDEMSPAAAAQLRVELTQMINNPVTPHGQYTVLAADVTATRADIVTGSKTAFTIANGAVEIRRAGTRVTDQATLTQPVTGTLRVASGGTYAITAGDVITWLVQP